MKTSILSFVVVLLAVQWDEHALGQAPDFQWVQIAGSSGGGSVINDLATDNMGNVYITGNIFGTAIFGTNKITSTSGQPDLFAAKFDTAGAFLWVTTGTGGRASAGASGFSIAVDSLGNSWVSGEFYENGTFGSTNLTVNVASSLAPPSGVFLKTDPQGAIVWATKIAWRPPMASAVDGSNYAYVVSDGIHKFAPSGDPVWSRGEGGPKLAVDDVGNYYVTGSAPAAGGYNDVRTIKYSSAGNVVWSKQAGGDRDDGGHALAVDKAGNCYVAGRFQRTATFDEKPLTSSGDYDIFIAKYDNAGNVVWAQRAGGPGFDEASGVALDLDGNCYVTGSFRGTGSFGNVSLSSAGLADIFVAKYDKDGSPLWALKAGTPDQSVSTTARGFSVDANGNCYLAGHFRGTAIFGSKTLAAAGPQGSSFIAKLPNRKPAIMTQPQNQTVVAGASVTFTVGASASSELPLSYQWQKDGLNLDGKTSASLILASAQSSDAGAYAVLVSNLDGSVSSASATLTVASPYFKAVGFSFLLGFRFTVSGDPETTARIETSTNLLDWAALTSLKFSSSPIVVTDPTATNYLGSRFYRAVRLP